MMIVAQNIERRFFRYAIQQDGCWGWSGKGLCRGYPLIRTTTQSYRANRVSWMIHRGIIPEGMHVLHHCDNPICTNPDHLFIGTHLDNINDMIAKGRGVFQVAPEKLRHAGSEHGNSKLTEHDVIEIRNLRAGGMRQWEIAKRFGITRGNVGHIVRRQAWAHV